ncbi:hypothetical protein Tcan_00244 [Toxocara canis]|uniref:Uncharacterized protein n=1 Tax=Toxocara canis TaxID=6265 RepID=A0A0B2UW36_TOXCA|nr:hypothetical protein Tcan_00244 [Toxocara canis]
MRIIIHGQNPHGSVGSLVVNVDRQFRKISTWWWLLCYVSFLIAFATYGDQKFMEYHKRLFRGKPMSQQFSSLFWNSAIGIECIFIRLLNEFSKKLALFSYGFAF